MMDGFAAADRFFKRLEEQRAELVARYPFEVMATVDLKPSEAVSRAMEGAAIYNWCVLNCKAGFKYVGNSINPKIWAIDHQLRFERQEDAALFKLFWC